MPHSAERGKYGRVAQTIALILPYRVPRPSSAWAGVFVVTDP